MSVTCENIGISGCSSFHFGKMLQVDGEFVQYPFWWQVTGSDLLIHEYTGRTYSVEGGAVYLPVLEGCKCGGVPVECDGWNTFANNGATAVTMTLTKCDGTTQTVTVAAGATSPCVQGSYVLPQNVTAEPCVQNNNCKYCANADEFGIWFEQNAWTALGGNMPIGGRPLTLCTSDDGGVCGGCKPDEYALSTNIENEYNVLRCKTTGEYVFLDSVPQARVINPPTIKTSGAPEFYADGSCNPNLEYEYIYYAKLKGCAEHIVKYDVTTYPPPPLVPTISYGWSVFGADPTSCDKFTLGIEIQWTINVWKNGGPIYTSALSPYLTSQAAAVAWFNANAGGFMTIDGIQYSFPYKFAGGSDPDEYLLTVQEIKNVPAIPCANQDSWCWGFTNRGVSLGASCDNAENLGACDWASRLAGAWRCG